MARLPAGVCVIAADDGETAHAMTASSFTSLSLDPPLVLFCVGRDARLFPILRRAGAFAVHILAADQRDVAELCAGGPADARLERLERAPTAPPRLAGALARFDCALHAEHPGGDHVIVVGAVRGLEMEPDRDKPALLWWLSAMSPLARS